MTRYRRPFTVLPTTLVALLILCWSVVDTPRQAIAGGEKRIFGAGHLSPEGLPAGIHRVHKSVADETSATKRPLAEVVADIPGVEAHINRHGEIIVAYTDHQGRAAYALMTAIRRPGKPPSISTQLIDAAYGKQLLAGSEPIAKSATARTLDGLAHAVEGQRTGRAKKLFKKLDARPLSRGQMSWAQDVVDRAVLDTRSEASSASDGNDLAMMSQALALRRAHEFGVVQALPRLPDDAVELWIPKDWTHVARLPSSELAPGKPLGTTSSFRAAVVERRKGVELTQENPVVEVDGVEYVRRFPKKRVAVGMATAGAIYLILRHNSQDECRDEAGQERECAAD